MKKALIVSTVSRQFTLFERGNIAVLKELGYEVQGAANYCDTTPGLDELQIIHNNIDIQRSPFCISNLKAYKQLVNLMKSEKFDLVHCHSPMGGVIGRLAARKTKNCKVIYTAHGFHFFKGAPLINNIVYKSIELFLSLFTDVLITINNEDFRAAQKFKLFSCLDVNYVPGIGVDTVAIREMNVDKVKKRNSLGINEGDFLVLTIGELIDRKNYKIALKAVKESNISNIKYLICGRGVLSEELKRYTKELGIEEKVIFAGYRSDIKEIVQIADIFLFPSKQEGLPVSLMEAMAAGIPIVASNIRGNADLIEDNINGFLHDPLCYHDVVKAITNLNKNDELRESMGLNNIKKSKRYDIRNIMIEMRKIYTLRR